MGGTTEGEPGYPTPAELCNDLRSRLGSDLENIVVVRSVDSTNRLACRVASEWIRDGVPCNPTLFYAVEQRAGRGRLGRRWVSPSTKGVYVSLLLPLDDSSLAGRLPVLAAVGLAKGIGRELGGTCNLKWPNDLYVADRKLGGVLIELMGRPGTSWAAVVGFGINLSHEETHLPGERFTSMSLLDHPVRMPGRFAGDLVLCVLREVGASDEFSTALEEFRTLMIHRVGDPMTCRVGSVVLVGSFLGLDEQGYLQLEVGGDVRRIGSGEIVEQREP